MRKRHVRAVRSIDKQVYTQPWSTSMYHDELRRRDKRVYYVAHITNNRIAGYGGAMIVHDEGHITSIAVHPETQRLGIAQRLMLAIHRRCLEHHITAMTLEVRVIQRAGPAPLSTIWIRPRRNQIRLLRRQPRRCTRDVVP